MKKILLITELGFAFYMSVLPYQNRMRSDLAKNKSDAGAESLCQSKTSR